jgi:hypothetical protein
LQTGGIKMTDFAQTLATGTTGSFPVTSGTHTINMDSYFTLNNSSGNAVSYTAADVAAWQQPH